MRGNAQPAHVSPLPPPSSAAVSAIPRHFTKHVSTPPKPRHFDGICAEGPESPTAALERKRKLSRIGYAMREHVKPRVAKCGRKRVASDVILTQTNGSPGGMGVMLCGSVWECPSCSAVRKTKRAQEIQRFAKGWQDAHGANTGYLLTLTLRHEGWDTPAGRRYHPLSLTGPAILDCKRRLFQGRAWKDFRETFGLEYISGWETTFGHRHGWHPHTHMYVVAARELTAREVAMVREWVCDRWMDIVSDHLGPTFCPTMNGLDFRPCTRGEYVSKLGLEVADVGKQGRTMEDGSRRRTPLQIAHDYSLHKRPQDAFLFREFVDTMRGRQMLTWSPRARKFFKALPEEEEPEKRFAAALAGEDFSELVKKRVRRAAPGLLHVRTETWTKGEDEEPSAAPKNWRSQYGGKRSDVETLARSPARGSASEYFPKDWAPDEWTPATVLASELAATDPRALLAFVGSLLGPAAAARTVDVSEYYERHYAHAIAYPGGIYQWMRDQETPGYKPPPLYPETSAADFQD